MLRHQGGDAIVASLVWKIWFQQFCKGYVIVSLVVYVTLEVDTSGLLNGVGLLAIVCSSVIIQ